MRRQVFQVDAFTTERFSGNPAGVVFPSDDLEAREMTLLARELGNSETAFIMSDMKTLRFFTPKQEVPLCTHATVASYHVMVTSLGLPYGRHVMHCKAGELPVEVKEHGKHPLIAVSQKAVQYGHLLGKEEQSLLEKAIGFPLAYVSLPIQWVSTGNPKILVPLQSISQLTALKPDRQALIALGNRIGCPGFYFFTLEKAEAGIDAHARMFSPGSGVDEDSVTGNAAGALAMYLKHYEKIEGKRACVIRQQDSLGRFGYISVHMDGEIPTITGTAVTVFGGSMDW